MESGSNPRPRARRSDAQLGYGLRRRQRRQEAMTGANAGALVA